MAGTNPVGTYQETSYPTATGSGYPAQIDSNFAVALRVANAFAPYPAATPAMAVYVGAGFVASISGSGQQAVTETGAVELAIAAAPASPNNRIDLIVVNATTGVASVVEGTPAATAVAPALPSGYLQVAQVSVPNGTTAITTAEITDLRAVWGSTSVSGGNSDGDLLIAGADYAVDTGTVNAIVASISPAPAALYEGLECEVKIANSTTGPTTLNLNGLGPTTVAVIASALIGGELPAGWIGRFRHNGSWWQLLNPAGIMPGSLVAEAAGATQIRIGDGAATEKYIGGGGAAFGANKSMALNVPTGDGFEFAAGGADMLIVADGVLQFAETPGGTLEQVWRSGLAALLANTTGYVKLPNGFILQWFQTNQGAGQPVLGFPTPFPTACLGAIVQPYGVWAVGTATYQLPAVTAMSASDVTLNIPTAGTGSSTTYTVIALGN